MKINQKQVRNSLIVAILIAVLCASSYYYGVSSSYVGTTSEVWVNPPFSEASYVVGQYNSTYYYAQNCTTGKYDFGNVAVSEGYVSSNASYVIQSCINSLTRGGKIFIKAGFYTITAMIHWQEKSITLIGEGSGTGGTAGANTPTCLKPTSAIGANPVIKIGALGVETQRGGIEDLTIDAYNGGARVATITGGIELIDTSYMTFKNVFLNYFCNDGLIQFGWYCHGQVYPLVTTTFANSFYDCQTYACQRHLILEGACDGYSFYSQKIMDGIPGSYGVLIDKLTTHCDSHKFYGLSIHLLDDVGDIGVYLKAAQAAEFYGTRFETGCTKEIQIDNTSNDCKFFGGAPHWNLITDNGVRTRFYGVGYGLDNQIENCGTGIGNGTQQYIAHHLKGQPNEVSVVPDVTGTTVTNIWADATNIYCTVTSGKAYHWSAKIV